MVPTTEEETPEAISEERNRTRGGGHNDHRKIDGSSNGQGDDALPVGEAQKSSALAIVMRGGLRQARVQVESMRHDRRSDHADRYRQRLAVRNRRDKQSPGRLAPLDGRKIQFRDVTETDDRYQGADDDLDWPRASALQHQDAVGYDRRDQHAERQGDVEEQRNAERAADKLSKVGCHRSDLADDPHRDAYGKRQSVPTDFRKIAARHDPKLCGKSLKKHCHKVGAQRHPKQGVPIAGPRLDIGREVPGVHVSDRRDDGWSSK